VAPVARFSVGDPIVLQRLRGNGSHQPRHHYPVQSIPLALHKHSLGDTVPPTRTGITFSQTLQLYITWIMGVRRYEEYKSTSDRRVVSALSPDDPSHGSCATLRQRHQSGTSVQLVHRVASDHMGARGLNTFRLCRGFMSSNNRSRVIA
jgi:hypothetical protein